MIKEAQFFADDGIDLPVLTQTEEDINDLKETDGMNGLKDFLSKEMDGESLKPGDEFIIIDEPSEGEEPENEEENLIEVEEKPNGELIISLDKIPGAVDQDDLEEPSVEVEEEDEVEINDDPWRWDIKSFVTWLSKKMQSVPTHSGRDTAGLERAIAYLEAVDREISRAVRTDLNNEIAIDAVEKARDEIQNGLERLHERLERVKTVKYPKNSKKKKADEEESGLKKEAQKAMHVGGIVVMVPLFISALARTCINGAITSGHDIEDSFYKLAKKFDLNEREQYELVQLLTDMNYPIRRDRGFKVGEEVDTTSSENFDWQANYTG